MSQSPVRLSMPARIVMRSATGISLNDRFTKLAQSRPPDSRHSPGGASSTVDAGQIVNGHHVMCPCGQQIRDTTHQFRYSPPPPSSPEPPYTPVFEDRLARKRVLDRLGRRSILREQGQRLRSLLGDRIRSLREAPRARVVVGRSRSRARYWRRDVDARLALDYLQRAPYWDNHVNTSQLWPDRHGQWGDSPPGSLTSRRTSNASVYPTYRPQPPRNVVVKRLQKQSNGKRPRTKFSLDRELSAYMNEGRKAKTMLNRQLGLQPDDT